MNDDVMEDNSQTGDNLLITCS